MAVRYSKRDQTKLVNRVKKLITQGKSLNAACTAVSEREGGQPATNTLANWVKAAGLPAIEATPEPAPEPAPEPRKRRRRTAPAVASDSTPAAVIPAAEPEQESTAAPQPEATSESTEALGAGEISQPLPDSDTDTAPAAELVHVRSTDTTVDSTADLDDLLDENLRLRTALTEANREIRAMRDLLVVYASR